MHHAVAMNTVAAAAVPARTAHSGVTSSRSARVVDWHRNKATAKAPTKRRRAPDAKAIASDAAAAVAGDDVVVARDGAVFYYAYGSNVGTKTMMGTRNTRPTR